jgi:hypothetical protein
MLENHVAKVSKRIENWRWNLSTSTRTIPPNVICMTSASELPVTTFTGSTPLNFGEHAEIVASKDDPDLAVFEVFSMEPGARLSMTNHGSGESPHIKQLSFSEFILSFPDELPLYAPTLENLLDIVALQPLATHARLLSSSLLELFLSDLDFIGHLDVLRRFILFGNAAFVSRIRNALFTDSDCANDTDGTQVHRARDRRRASSRQGHLRRPYSMGDRNKHKPWGVGLNPVLSDQGSWPPAGSDLAFSLRRVIVDSLDEERYETEEGERRTGQGKSRDLIWEEAEWRLGFIIKPFDEDEELGDKDPAWADAFCEFRFSVRR